MQGSPAALRAAFLHPEAHLDGLASVEQLSDVKHLVSEHNVHRFGIFVEHVSALA